MIILGSLLIFGMIFLYHIAGHVRAIIDRHMAIQFFVYFFPGIIHFTIYPSNI